MFQAYIFFLILSGGLALISVLGDFIDADVGELDADIDVDFDADVDVDPEVDVAGEVDVEAGTESAAEADVDAEKILSMRGMLYTFFGFGLSGTALSLRGADPAAPLTVAVAGASGLTAGWLVTRLMTWLKRSQIGERAADSTFEGRFGRMILNMDEGSRGRVRIRRGERTYDLRALPHPSAEVGSDPSQWTEVLVVELKEGVAYVIPRDEDTRELGF